MAANSRKWGVGGVNIDAGRVFTDWAERSESWKRGGNGKEVTSMFGMLAKGMNLHSKGRWPSNIILEHSPECRCVGSKQIKGSHLDHDCHGVAFRSDTAPVHKTGHTDAKGNETIADWECTPDCPVAALDEQGGLRRSAYPGRPDKAEEHYLTPCRVTNLVYSKGVANRANHAYSDRGGASRFFKQVQGDQE